MVQTGHWRFRDNFRDIAMDYLLDPPKPVLDGEPGYENIPSAFLVGNGVISAFECRQFAYWAVFAGACGHTYGCNEVFQFFDLKCEGHFNASIHWKEAVGLLGAGQMLHVRRLLESRPYLTRIPDQGLILDDQRFLGEHMQATRDGTKGRCDATYAMVYIPGAKPVTVRTALISSPRLVQRWYNPRNGHADLAGTIDNAPSIQFTPPTSAYGDDWVLVLDAPEKNYRAPGTPMKNE